MNKRIKIANGWIIEIDISESTENYTIENIQALFGHGVWFDIDTTHLTQEQWDIFHERIKERREEIKSHNERELDRHYQRMSEGFITREAGA